MTHPDPVNREDETLTGELGSEGGSGGDLRQSARTQDEERAPLGPPLILAAVIVVVVAALLWLVLALN